MALMGKQDLPGELNPGILVDFAKSRGFTLDKSEGSHMLYRKPGWGHVSIPNKPIPTRRNSWTFKNILTACGATRKEFTEWLRAH
jgi:predicted RNA binding protein YcfA (HicA-like mRNA interferase family)